MLATTWRTCDHTRPAPETCPAHPSRSRARFMLDSTDLQDGPDKVAPRTHAMRSPSWQLLASSCLSPVCAFAHACSSARDLSYPWLLMYILVRVQDLVTDSHPSGGPPTPAPLPSFTAGHFPTNPRTRPPTQPAGHDSHVSLPLLGRCRHCLRLHARGDRCEPGWQAGVRGAAPPARGAQADPPSSPCPSWAQGLPWAWSSSKSTTTGSGRTARAC